jgi:hypothetical protein
MNAVSDVAENSSSKADIESPKSHPPMKAPRIPTTIAPNEAYFDAFATASARRLAMPPTMIQSTSWSRVISTSYNLDIEYQTGMSTAASS